MDDESLKRNSNKERQSTFLPQWTWFDPVNEALLWFWWASSNSTYWKLCLLTWWWYIVKVKCKSLNLMWGIFSLSHVALGLCDTLILLLFHLLDFSLFWHRTFPCNFGWHQTLSTSPMAHFLTSTPPCSLAFCITLKKALVPFRAFNLLCTIQLLPTTRTDISLLTIIALWLIIDSVRVFPFLSQHMAIIEEKPGLFSCDLSLYISFLFTWHWAVKLAKNVSKSLGLEFPGNSGPQIHKYPFLSKQLPIPTFGVLSSKLCFSECKYPIGAGLASVYL